ncbi:2-oxo-4-hydroxy-4-carboxy-5-ureidoimidazoline decarboxylase [Alkalihalobacillus sp. FSL W8-0930]
MSVIKQTLDQLNHCSPEEFVETLAGMYEHSPWVAEQVVNYRPFKSIHSLYEAMKMEVSQSDEATKLNLLCAHPNLGERIQMTDSSKAEQSQAGLTELTEEEFKSFKALNKRYMATFTFPFILAVKGKKKQEIYHEMERRVHHSAETEFDTALAEVDKIALFRLKDLIQE